MQLGGVQCLSLALDRWFDPSKNFVGFQAVNEALAKSRLDRKSACRWFDSVPGHQVKKPLPEMVGAFSFPDIWGAVADGARAVLSTNPFRHVVAVNSFKLE
mgnify:CR=1 FL=1